MGEIDSELNSVEKAYSTFAAIVPQLFFDLIARIIPGFAIIWSFYLALLNNSMINVTKIYEKARDLTPDSTFVFF